MLLKAFLRLVYYSVLGVVVGVAIPPLTANSNFNVFFLFIGYFLGLLFIHIVVHELAHALVMRMAGFVITLLMFGPLVLRRGWSGWRAQLKPVIVLGGATLGTPDDKEFSQRRLAPRIAQGVAAGPLANLVLALLAGAAYLILPGLSPVAQAWLLGLAGVGVMMGIHNLVPQQSMGMHSDGSRLWTLLTGGQKADLMCRTYFLSGVARRLRPRLWDPAWLQPLMAASNNPAYQGLGYYLGYLMLLDRAVVDGVVQDAAVLEQAAWYLDQALMRQDEIFINTRSELLAEAAYFEAWQRQNPARARQLLAQAPVMILESGYSRLRAQAAILLAEGKPAQALNQVADAMPLVRDSIEPGTAQAEGDWLQGLEAQIRQQVSKALPLTRDEQRALRPLPLKLKPPEAAYSWSWRLIHWVGVFLFPMLVFFVLIFTIGILTGPPECQPRLLGNLACKVHFSQVYFRAGYLQAAGDDEQAYRLLAEAVAIQPGLLGPQLRLGYTAQNLGDHEQALQTFSRLIELYPDDPYAYVGRAHSLHSLGRNAEALDDYVAGLGFDYDSNLVYESERMLPALVKQVMKDDPTWLNKLEAYSAGHPEDTASYCKLGLAYRVNGDDRALNNAWVTGSEADVDYVYWWCWEWLSAP